MISEQIMAIIDTIAQKLGVAAEAVYPMLLKQAEVFAVSYHVTLWVLVLSALLTIATVILYFVSRKNKWDCTPAWEHMVVLCVIVTMGAAVIAMIDASEYITAMYNPDAWAVKYILNLIR